MSGSSSRSNSIESPYFIRKIRPIVPPKFYPPIYDPGFELAVPDMFKIVTTYQIEYDPGFEIPIKVKPQFSQLPEPTGAEQYATPYDPGFRLPVKTEIPTSYSLEYNPGFELPVAPAIAICPQHPGAPQVYPAVYNPGFELPERQTIQPPQAYPAVYNPGFDLPETLPQSFPPSYYPEFGLSNANNRPVIPPSRPSYGLASLSYPDSELRNCEPDCEPPPAIGFIYQPSAPVEVVPTEKTEEFGTDFTESHRWAAASTSDCAKPGALLVGHDQDGSPIFAGRAYHNGDVLPAKVIPAKNACYVAYGGEEIVKDQFEVLCQNTLTWVWASGGNVPSGAVQIGNTSDGETLYLGRVHSDGAITPGKVHPSHGCCYYPFDGEEKSSTEYEVLIAQ